MSRKTLIVVTGATASGKTALAVSLARVLGCEIISADSRQMYRDIPIGTASPTPAETEGVTYRLTGVLELEDYYSAARFEEDALRLLSEAWRTNRYAIVCGGSMMYVNALLYGIDEMPTIEPAVREAVLKLYEAEGLEGVLRELRERDPEYYELVDRNNTRRVIHAVEICRQSGVTYTSLRTGRRKTRDFDVIKLAVSREREDLFGRINRRVEEMMAQGLEAEARRVYAKRHLNSLNTVGYKELFAYFDGATDRETAVARIAKNTRVYAKKQLTLMARHDDVHYLSPRDAVGEALKIIGIKGDEN